MTNSLICGLKKDNYANDWVRSFSSPANVTAIEIFRKICHFLVIVCQTVIF